MEKSMKKFQSFLHTFFAYGKMAAQKHGYKSLPDSIAGLSESGVNAEHTGKSCSRLELVVRECGLMLMKRLFCCAWLDWPCFITCVHCVREIGNGSGMNIHVFAHSCLPGTITQPEEEREKERKREREREAAGCLISSLFAAQLLGKKGTNEKRPQKK